MIAASIVTCFALEATTTLGRTANHPIVKGETSIGAARRSTDRHLGTIGEGLRAAEYADLSVDAASGYWVTFGGRYCGEFALLKFLGIFDL